MKKALLKFDILVASFFINLLALAVPLYVIQALTRFLSNGVNETLYALTIGVLIAVILEFLFKSYRKSALLNLFNESNPSANFFNKLININFLDPSLYKFKSLPQKFKNIRDKESQININMLQNLHDLPYVFIFLFVIYILSPKIFLLVLLLSIIGIIIRMIQSVFEQKSLRNYINSKQNHEYLEYELIKNFSNIQLFSNIKKLYSSLNINQNTIAKNESNYRSNILSWNFIQNFLSTILTVLVVFISVIDIYNGELQIASMIALNILTIRTFLPILSIPKIISFIFTNSSNEMDRILNVASIKNKKTQLNKFNGQIELKEISHKFPEQKTSLYENFSFKFEKGSTTVITGKNGTGKTTLFKIITGLITSTEGKILIDNVNLEQIDREWLRKQFVAVPQEPIFFEETIASNLLFVSEDLTDEKISRAVNLSGLDEILADHDQGLNAKINSINNEFSLGIRKRISLARAILIDGNFVIFDEPTEGLDIDGANIFYSFLNSCINSEKTVVVLSHDPAIIKGANTIVDLNHRPSPIIKSGPRSTNNLE